MQSFLPYPDFAKSAKCLDRLRLGKQRIEVLQILNTIAYGSRWANHPAVNMWRGHEHYLIAYGVAVCKEWISRGYQDTCYEKIAAFGKIFPEGDYPLFIGDEAFHSAHRAALLAKNYAHYSVFGWNERPAINYVWPTKEK